MPMRPTPLTISPHRRPKVLLLGNGMNRVFGGASWSGLLEKINRSGIGPGGLGGEIVQPILIVQLHQGLQQPQH